MRLFKSPVIYRILFACFFFTAGFCFSKFRDLNYSLTRSINLVKQNLGIKLPPKEVAHSTPANPLRADFSGVRSPAHPEWKVRRGLDVKLVATGFTYPVNIAFATSKVGDNPSSPFFYVCELHGSIKYVAKDGTTHVYAKDITNIVPEDMFFSDESGIVGLTTIPDSEDLVVTYSFLDSKVGLLGSKIVRLVSAPGGKKLDHTELILDLNEPTARSHQIQSAHIGPDGLLYVAVGDGEDPGRALDREKFGGKILRMNLDGTPSKDNPFYQRNVPTTPSHYVYAYGFRNPFDMDFHPDNGELYGSDNGPSVDRLVNIRKGASYGYTGSNASMRTNALYTWGEGENPGPAGMTFLDEAVLGKDSRGLGYLAMASNPRKLLGQSIWEVKIDTETGGQSDIPQPILNYMGDTKTTVVGLAEGPDGLYFTDFFGDSRGVGNDAGHGRIWKLVPSEETLQLIPETELAKASPKDRGRTYFEKNCRVCHSLGNRGGNVGPHLDNLPATLSKRLHSEVYEKTVQRLLKSDSEYFVSQRPKLKNVLNSAADARLPLWLEYHISDPRFDNPFSKMPQFERTLTKEQRDDIIQFLLELKEN